MAEQDLPEPSAPTPTEQPHGREPIPWLWLGLGLLVTILGCLAAAFLVSQWLSAPPQSTGPVQPVVIVLTAPPSATPAPTSPPLAPTPIPTFTPIPTPDTAVAPAEIKPGFYVEVANTDNLGVTVRGGPSTRNVVVTTAGEGSRFLVLDGPTEAENFQWWNVQLDNGLEGWVVQNFIIPAAAP
jgi:hypothetical protein